MLNCPKCNSAIEDLDLFKNCTVSWPNQKWLWFVCPNCKNDFNVQLSNEGVSIGFIDGAPGPCYIPETPTLKLEKFSFKTTRYGIEVILRENTFKFRHR